jgi:hypothetical protein
VGIAVVVNFSQMTERTLLELPPSGRVTQAGMECPVPHRIQAQPAHIGEVSQTPEKELDQNTPRYLSMINELYHGILVHLLNNSLHEGRIFFFLWWYWSLNSGLCTCCSA